jgi:molybdenum cofactor biosynthesis enzyme MoaA
MKLRTEPLGHHYFDRKTGLHFLLDEFETSVAEYSIAPRTLSLAVTNECNLNCSFCHVEKGQTSLSVDTIIKLCKEFDRLGTFDVAIGGGEPLMHKDLPQICKRIWKETSLGLSITTNGTLLNSELISELKNYVSFLRISIDSINQVVYRSIRSYEVDVIASKLLLLKNKIPYGINVVINSQTIPDLNKLLEFALKHEAEELLLLPEINNNEFVLTKNEWKYLEKWIVDNMDRIPLRIIDRARKMINVPMLFDSQEYFEDYKYVDVNLKIKNSSYETEFELLDIDKTENVLKKWRSAAHIE